MEHFAPEEQSSIFNNIVNNMIFQKLPKGIVSNKGLINWLLLKTKLVRKKPCLYKNKCKNRGSYMSADYILFLWNEFTIMIWHEL